MSRLPRSLILITSVWLACLAVGLWLDAPVARIAHRAAIDRDHFGNHVMKMAGDWRFTLAVALALLVWHRDTWRPAGLLALSAAVGGVLYTLVKWSAGRQRPLVLIDPLRFTPFINGWKGFWDEPNLSFPSGHTCLAFATAATLAIWLPRWRWAFYALAAVVGAERVAENAHYLTDVIAGAGLGVLSGYLTFWVMDYFYPRPTMPDGTTRASTPASTRVEKSEIRSTKIETNSKSNGESTKREARPLRFVLWIWSFEFVSSFVLRASDLNATAYT